MIDQLRSYGNTLTGLPLLTMSDVYGDILWTPNDVTPTTVAAPGGNLAFLAVFASTALSLIICVTLLGNGLVVGAVMTTRSLRNTANYFVLSLAVTDITVALLVMPFSAVYSVSGRWHFGCTFCYFWVSCDVMCCTASILHLCAIATYRYVAITRPFRYKMLMSTRRTYLLIAAIWTCSATISFLPIYLGWFSPHDNSNACSDDTFTCGLQVNPVYGVISSMTSFYVPLVIITVIYVKIFRIARHQAGTIRQQEVVPFVSTRAQSDFNVKRKCARKHTKAVKTLGTLMGLFVVSWLPFFLLYVIVPFCDDCSVPTEVTAFVTWLGYVNSCFNPGVYAFLNRDFRRAFKRILCCSGATDDSRVTYNMRPVSYSDTNKL